MVAAALGSTDESFQVSFSTANSATTWSLPRTLRAVLVDP